MKCKIGTDVFDMLFGKENLTFYSERRGFKNQNITTFTYKDFENMEIGPDSNMSLRAAAWIVNYGNVDYLHCTVSAPKPTCN